MKTRPIWFIERVPVMQNRVYRSLERALACELGKIDLVQHETSGLVFNRAFNSDSTLYDGEYQNEQASSGLFQAHLDDVVSVLKGVLSTDTRVVEIGCGKGTFLGKLRASGIPAVGFDPTYEGEARWIEKRFFDGTQSFQADLIVMRHVLEHVPNPYDFLASIRDANAGIGSVYIEVPNFDWIVNEGAFFDVFYEHCNYFNPGSLAAHFSKVRRAGSLFGGQYQYLIADWKDYSATPRYSGPAYHRLDEWDRHIDGVVSRLSKRTFIWGAAAKGATLAWWMKCRGKSILAAIDINPAKQGGYLPGSGSPVLSPSQARAVVRPRDAIVIMNPVYSREIRSGFSGEFDFVDLSLKAQAIAR